jgi:hypothetical protein
VTVSGFFPPEPTILVVQVTVVVFGDKRFVGAVRYPFSCCLAT